MARLHVFGRIALLALGLSAMAAVLGMYAILFRPQLPGPTETATSEVIVYGQPPIIQPTLTWDIRSDATHWVGASKHFIQADELRVMSHEADILGVVQRIDQISDDVVRLRVLALKDEKADLLEAYVMVRTTTSVYAEFRKAVSLKLGSRVAVKHTGYMLLSNPPIITARYLAILD